MENRKLCQLYANMVGCADYKTEKHYKVSCTSSGFVLVPAAVDFQPSHAAVFCRGQRMFPPLPMQDAAMFSRVTD
jgi:hypothetical protein